MIENSKELCHMILGTDMQLKRIRSYQEMSRSLSCNRHLRHRPSLIGGGTLNNLTLFWDDLDETIKNDPKNLEKFYKFLHKVIDYYFLPNDRENAFRVTKQWIDIETNLKNGDL